MNPVNPSIPAVVHVAPRVRPRGGIESLIAHLQEHPGASARVGLFDPREDEPGGSVGLGATWRTPLWLMRRRLRAALAPHPGALVIYHNGWGLPLFHADDRAARRVVLLHADPVYHRSDLPSLTGLFDGVLGSCPGLRALWSGEQPLFPADRAEVFRMPLNFPPAAARGESRAGGPLVLGYAGRIERAQKCLHLLPGLVRELEARGVDFRFEVVGEGSLRRWLETQTGPRVRYLGWVEPNAAYLRTLAAWDAAVYFSDHEGGPIALLEAMACGALPFYPRGHGSWADHYVPQVDPRCHYRPGDIRSLAEAIIALLTDDPARRAARRVAASRLVSGHEVRQFQEQCAEFCARIARLPRISVARSRRPRWTDLLPLGFVTRALPSALRKR